MMLDGAIWITRDLALCLSLPRWRVWGVTLV